MIKNPFIGRFGQLPKDIENPFIGRFGETGGITAQTAVAPIKMPSAERIIERAKEERFGVIRAPTTLEGIRFFRIPEAWNKLKEITENPIIQTTIPQSFTVRQAMHEAEVTAPLILGGTPEERQDAFMNLIIWGSMFLTPEKIGVQALQKIKAEAPKIAKSIKELPKIVSNAKTKFLELTRKAERPAVELLGGVKGEAGILRVRKGEPFTFEGKGKVDVSELDYYEKELYNRLKESLKREPTIKEMLGDAFTVSGGIRRPPIQRIKQPSAYNMEAKFTGKPISDIYNKFSKVIPEFESNPSFILQKDKTLLYKTKNTQIKLSPEYIDELPIIGGEGQININKLKDGSKITFTKDGKVLINDELAFTPFINYKKLSPEDSKLAETLQEKLGGRLPTQDEFNIAKGIPAIKPTPAIPKPKIIPAVKPVAKEPWQMTRVEWEKKVLKEKGFTPAQGSHKSYVDEAIDAGKSIPDEVLDEYYPKLIPSKIGKAEEFVLPTGQAVKPVKPVAKEIGVKGEFKVGDIIDSQGNSNMVGNATIREIKGNSIYFTDSEGSTFTGIQRSDIRKLIESGKWKKVSQQGKPAPTIPIKRTEMPLTSEVMPKEGIITPEVGIGKIPPEKPPAPPVSPETPIGKITYDIPEDLGDSFMNKIRGLGARSFAPIREVASRNPVAGAVARLGRNTTTALESDIKGVNDTITKVFKGIKTDAQKQELTRLIESGLSNEEVLKLSEPYKSAILGKRDLTRAIEQIAKDEFKIDISQWRYNPTNYMHHLFKGRQRVVNATTGRTIGFAENRVKSLEMAENFLKNNPTAQISIKPAFDPKQFSATMVSQKGFWRFMNEVAKKLASTPEEVLSELNFKGLLAIKPRPKFVGAFKQRVANLEGYLQDPAYVERSVWYKVLRKRHIQPFEKTATSLLNKLPPNYRKEMETYIKTISSGFDPYAISGILSEASKWQTILKLGYRPIAALVNRLQPLQTAFQDVSIKNFVKGFFMKYTDKGKQLLQEMKITQIPKYYAGELGKPLGTELYKPMGMFSLAERGTRTDAGLMGYYEMMNKLTKNPELFKTINSNMEIAGLGKFAFKTPHDMSIQFGKDLVSGTQFLYTSADTGIWFRNRTFATTLGKFRPFTINYLYNLKNIVLGKPLAGLEQYYPKGIPIGQKLLRIGKFAGANFSIGGLKVLTFGIERALPIGYLTYLFIQHPIIARGLAGALGVDLSRNIGIEPFEMIPTNVWELMGVYGSDIRNIKNGIQSGIAGDYKGMGSHLTKISPAVNRIYELLVMDDYLRSPYKRQRPVAEFTTTEKVMFGLGAKPLSMAKREDINRYINITTQQYKDKKAQYVDDIIRAVNKKDHQKIKELVREAQADKILLTVQDIRMEYQKKTAKEPLLIKLKQTPKALRPELMKIIREQKNPFIGRFDKKVEQENPFIGRFKQAE